MKYIIRALEFYECPVCKERVYDRASMQRIEAASPAFAPARAQKRLRPAKPAAEDARPAIRSTDA